MSSEDATNQERVSAARVACEAWLDQLAGEGPSVTMVCAYDAIER